MYKLSRLRNSVFHVYSLMQNQDFILYTYNESRRGNICRMVRTKWEEGKKWNGER